MADGLNLKLHSVANSAVPGATIELDAEMFGVRPNIPVMHQVVSAQLAHRRAGTQSTKTRAEVSGGGKKPFKQKGTGNARQGSTRAPHFSGGGVALGPKPRKYTQKTPKKMIKLALRSALSDRAIGGQVVVVDDWGLEAPSTKSAVAALSKLGITGSVLLVHDRNEVNVVKSFRNLQNVQLIEPGELNAYDILCNETIVFTAANLPTGTQICNSDRRDTTDRAHPLPSTEMDGREMKLYRIAKRDAVHFSASDEYLKVEQYEAGMSVNWTTRQGPEGLLHVAALWNNATIEFWELTRTSHERPVAEFGDLAAEFAAPIRATLTPIAGDRLAVWRIIGADLDIYQIGVLLDRFDGDLIRNLIDRTASPAVKSSYGRWFEAAEEVTSLKLSLGR